MRKTNQVTSHLPHTILHFSPSNSMTLKILRPTSFSPHFFYNKISYMKMSIERPAQGTSDKLQATDSSYKLQDTSQPICKILKLPSCMIQATSYRFFGLTSFPVWHFQPGKHFHGSLVAWLIYAGQGWLEGRSESKRICCVINKRFVGFIA